MDGSTPSCSERAVEGFKLQIHSHITSRTLNLPCGTLLFFFFAGLQCPL